MQLHYDFLHQLLVLLEEYQAEEGQSTPLAFATWVVEHQAQPLTPNQQPGAHLEVRSGRESREALLARLLEHVHTHKKYALKIILDAHGMTSKDDFAFMATLLYKPGLTQSELIHLNQLEVPSGMEVIKRLKRMQWVVEETDPMDRRAKRLQLTPAGQARIRGSFADMDQNAKRFYEPLSNRERQLLLGLLSKLDAYHQEQRKTTKRRPAAPSA